TEEEDNQSQHKELSKSKEMDADNVLDELANMKDFIDKTSLLEPLSHLYDELSNLTTKVTKTIHKQFKAFNKRKSARFVVLQKELGRVLKSKMGSSIHQQVNKGMEEVKGKLEYYTSSVDQNSVNVQDMTTLIRDMVHILESALVFAKANAEGEKWEKMEALKQEKEKSEESLQKIKNPTNIQAQVKKILEYEAKRAKILTEYNYYITFRANQEESPRSTIELT
ncbi:hypothetical protein Tco_1276621, partial [Tanacetum coccineum]